VSPADNNYQGGFATALKLKDLKLAIEAAQSVGADTPMGKRAAELYQAFADAGSGGQDFSAIIKTLSGLYRCQLESLPRGRMIG
jgi:3-hydroxyisobutyrate dehydrogenase